jgi:hypothetical protein
MTIELFYLTTQFQRWLNLQIAHHLEAQAARLGPADAPSASDGPVALRKLGADGAIGSAAEFGRMGMSGCFGPVDATDGDTSRDDDAASASCPSARTGVLAGEKHTVRA